MTLAICTPSAAFTFRVDPEHPHQKQTLHALLRHQQRFKQIALWFSRHLAQEYTCIIRPHWKVTVTRDHETLWIRCRRQSRRPVITAVDLDANPRPQPTIAPMPLRELAQLYPSAETIALLAQLSPDDI